MNDLNNALYADQRSFYGAVYATQFFTGLGPINTSLAKSGMSRLDLIRMYEKAIAEKHGRAEQPQSVPLPKKRKVMRRQREDAPVAPVLNAPPKAPQVSTSMQLEQARQIMRQMIAQHRLSTLTTV